jgi:hypothetical protein
MIRTYPALVLMPVLSALIGTAFCAEKAPKASKKEKPQAIIAKAPLQLRIDALTTLRDAINSVRGKAKLRTDLLDKYLKDNKLWEDYFKLRSELKTTSPEVGHWNDERPDSKELVPLTFNDAYVIAIDYEKEQGGEGEEDDGSSELLQRQEKALRAMARKEFNRVIKEMVEVERKVEFIKERKQWDKALAWANTELAKREDKRKEDLEVAKKEAVEKRKEREAEAERKADKRKQERAEGLERAWQRKAESYQLRTNRIEAENSRNYSYPRRYHYPSRSW